MGTLEGVFALHLAKLGGHQTQHHGFAFGQEAQGAEVAAAVIVVFQKVGIDVYLGQQGFGYGFVVATGGKRAGAASL
jgi:hypothetical protein